MDSAEPQKKVSLFGWVQKSWAFNFKFVFISLIFLLLQFAIQYYFYVPGIIDMSIVRALAFSGATLIGLSLLSSIAFKFKPLLSKYSFVRKNLGVMGFIFIFFHVIAAIQFYFFGDLSKVYFSFNPLENPIVFGALAYPILFVMAITSIQWVEHKIGGTWWKALHRLVYFAFLFIVFHFTQQNPAALNSIPGYFLILVTAGVLLGELYWFFMVSKQRQFKNPGFYIGLAIILLYIILGYLAFFAK